MPEFIPATHEDGIAGWVRRDDVLPPDGERLIDVVPVFGDNLASLVGHMHPGIGFVPLGVDPASVRSAGQDRNLSLRIRNESDRRITVDVIEAPDEAVGRPARVAPSVLIEAGEETTTVIHVFRDRWALTLRGGDGGFIYSTALGDHYRDLEAGRITDFGLVITTAGILEVRTAP